jgi:hypothetical protein
VIEEASGFSGTVAPPEAWSLWSVVERSAKVRQREFFSSGAGLKPMVLVGAIRISAPV